MGGLLTALVVPLLLAAAVVHDPEAHEWDFVVLPIVSANVDEGVGGGLVAGLYHYNGGVEPLRDDLSVRLFATSKLVQRHELRWDGRQVLGLPLRVWLRFSLFSTVTLPYCGVGNDVTCDLADAGRAAPPSLLPGSQSYDDFVRHYYAMRYIRPGGDTLLRWRLLEHFELMGGWRLNWYKPGDFTHYGPYPGSLYAQRFPKGEPGVSSVWQAGFIVDERDIETAPTRGYLLEGSVRAASPWWGSKWTYEGINTALSTYLALSHEPDVVFANRALVDILDGDVPTAEIAETGGTRDHAAFGGQWIGRGVRDHRFIGKVKIVDQAELRRDFFEVTIANFVIDVGGSVFVDAGWIGESLEQVGGDPFRILYGGGAGLRLMFQNAILMRVDLAASPFETQQPSFYTPVGFPF